MNNKLSIQEFKNEYSFNEYRETMISSFEDYLDYLKSIFKNFKVVIFGSFITEKEDPNDIDILVFGSLNNKGKSDILSQGGKLKKYDYIHSKFQTTNDVIETNQMICKFNNEPTNVESGISIKNYIEINIPAQSDLQFD
jgi:predicted nucleotidyltransferase